MDRLSAARASIARTWENGAAIIGVPMSYLDTFSGYLSTPPNTECWIWTGPKKKSDGRGQFTWTKQDGTKKNSKTHRLMYELSNRRLVKESIPVVATCGNDLCFRPEHLKEQPRGGKGTRGGHGAYK